MESPGSCEASSSDLFLAEVKVADSAPGGSALHPPRPLLIRQRKHRDADGVRSLALHAWRAWGPD